DSFPARPECEVLSHSALAGACPHRQVNRRQKPDRRLLLEYWLCQPSCHQGKEAAWLPCEARRIRCALTGLFPSKIVLDLLEKRFAMGRNIRVLNLGQLPKQLFLVWLEFLGNLDEGLHEQVSRSAAAWIRHAPAPKAKDFAGLRAGANRQFMLSLQRGDF